MLKSDRWTKFEKKNREVERCFDFWLGPLQDPTMTEYFCRLHLPHTHTKKNLGSYTKKRKNGKTTYAYSKKKKTFEDFIQEKNKNACQYFEPAAVLTTTMKLISTKKRYISLLCYLLNTN